MDTLSLPSDPYSQLEGGLVYHVSKVIQIVLGDDLELEEGISSDAGNLNGGTMGLLNLGLLRWSL
jgi:hypothetical protein